MTASFQDQIAADAAAFLNAGEEGFSEPVTYTPAGSSARTVYAIIEDSQQTELSDVGDETAVERIRVYVSRDGTEGIDAPQITDTLVRTLDARPYVFSGDIPESNQAAWVLVFWRRKVSGRGVRS